LFTVQHHSESSFTVTSGDATARVLGTSFLVRHYPDDTATTVAVRGGKVGVKSLVLSAWQQSEVTAHAAARVHAVAPSRFDFATGVLTLDAMSLRDAVVELSRWYDLDIRLGDSSLATRRIDGGFVAGASADLIAIFEQTLDVRVVREGRKMTLYPRSDR
jgi:transmembrane sensor